MDINKLIQSKTFWTGIAAIASGVVTIVKGDTSSGIQLVATGLSAIFIRDAIK